YGLHQSSEERLAAVIDLGGGTFDVSIVEQFEGVVEIRSSAGEIFLGGEDFTSTMTAAVLKRRGLVLEHEEAAAPLMVSRLRRECESAKRILSREPTARVRIPNREGGITPEAPVEVVTREQFAEWTSAILRRVDGPLRRVLGDAKLSPQKVEQVILVGGASRMPQLVDHVTQLFGKPPICDLNPDEVVALGAAVQGGLVDRHSSVGDLVVTDVSPFTLGVEVSREIAGKRVDGYFLPIISRNTTIPCSRIETVSTLEPSQTVINLKVYQGEDRRVENNMLLGRLEVTGIPRGPQTQPVDLRFTYDLNGVLEVEAEILATRKKFTLVISRHAPSLSPEQIDDAVRNLQALKRHPRDDEPNRLALRRAERLFRDLPLGGRDILDRLLTGFESALEEQDPHQIQEWRTALEVFLDENDLDANGGLYGNA
ncbi:MAG TPA: Hsp70 family protein, partial [Caulifigura sp.]|nr:Hsp70 family protein [Caulifigura sp.]